MVKRHFAALAIVCAAALSAACDDNGGSAAPTAAPSSDVLQPRLVPTSASTLEAVSPILVEPPLTEGPAVQAAGDPRDLPPYQVYTVQEGDSVVAIAARYGILPEYLVANNAELSDPPSLIPGMSLIVPSGNGILHEVRPGETLADIAARYGVTVESIVRHRTNGITSTDDLLESALLFIPDAPLPAPTPGG
jgi:LysM repeat protein